jgi:hypothetical protein
MKRTLLTLSILALVGSVSVSMAQPEYEMTKTTKTVVMSKPGMEKMVRPVMVTIEGPIDLMKEHTTLDIAGHEVQATGGKFSINLTPEQLNRLREQRAIRFGAKGFLQNCHKVIITHSNEPSEKAALVNIKAGLKSENGMEKPVCESADITVFRFI